MMMKQKKNVKTMKSFSKLIKNILTFTIITVVKTKTLTLNIS